MKFTFKKNIFENSLVVQWLTLGVSTARAWVQSPVQGTKIPQAKQDASLPKKKKKKNQNILQIFKILIWRLWSFGGEKYINDFNTVW